MILQKKKCVGPMKTLSWSRTALLRVQQALIEHGEHLRRSSFVAVTRGPLILRVSTSCSMTVPPAVLLCQLFETL